MSPAFAGCSSSSHPTHSLRCGLLVCRQLRWLGHLARISHRQAEDWNTEIHGRARRVCCPTSGSSESSGNHGGCPLTALRSHTGSSSKHSDTLDASCRRHTFRAFRVLPCSSPLLAGEISGLEASGIHTGLVWVRDMKVPPSQNTRKHEEI